MMLRAVHESKLPEAVLLQKLKKLYNIVCITKDNNYICNCNNHNNLYCHGCRTQKTRKAF